MRLLLFIIIIVTVDEVERLICSFYVSVAALTTVWADPSLRYGMRVAGTWALNLVLKMTLS